MMICEIPLFLAAYYAISPYYQKRLIKIRHFEGSTVVVTAVEEKAMASSIRNIFIHISLYIFENIWQSPQSNVSLEVGHSPAPSHHRSDRL